MTSLISTFLRIPWSSQNTSVFEASNTSNDRNSSFIDDVEMEDVSDEEAMDYEITSNESFQDIVTSDFRDPVAEVRQIEEDVILAVLLQVQYNAEFLDQFINGREQRNFIVSSSSQSSQVHRDPLQSITLLLRRWEPFFLDNFESLLQISIELGDQPKGLNEHEITVLPTRKFLSSEQAEANSIKSVYQDCTICLCEYKNEDVLRTLPCGHEFHVACIDKWLKLHNTCPMCRTEISRQPV